MIDDDDDTDIDYTTDRYRPAKAKRPTNRPPRPQLKVNGQSFDHADLAYMRPEDKAEILELLRRE